MFDPFDVFKVDDDDQPVWEASVLTFDDAQKLVQQRVSSLTSARKQGGELKLLNLSAKIRYLMEITRLDTFFDVTNDEATGVKSLAQFRAVTA
jgi:anti-anti-sigma regulatory factor